MTPNERSWLESAERRGLTGFFAWPSATLRRLEAEGLLERDPTTKGVNTRWRITAAGEQRLAKDAST